MRKSRNFTVKVTKLLWNSAVSMMMLGLCFCSKSIHELLLWEILTERQERFLIPPNPQRDSGSHPQNPSCWREIEQAKLHWTYCCQSLLLWLLPFLDKQCRSLASRLLMLKPYWILQARFLKWFRVQRGKQEYLHLSLSEHWFQNMEFQAWIVTVRMSAELTGASWALTLLQCLTQCQVYAPCTFLTLLLPLPYFFSSPLHPFFMPAYEFICGQE